MPETATTAVTFFVPGLPATGGSKRSMVSASTGKIVTLDDCRRNKDWRAVVALAARQAMAGRPPLEGPLHLEVRFVLPRPRGHYGTGRNAGRVRRGAPAYPAVKPDCLKLVRSTEDALTGIVWRDDAQNVLIHAVKAYGETPGVEIVVQWLNVSGVATA